jgi:myotubularin-related protein 1/2
MLYLRRQVLKGAVFVASSLDSGDSVLVHCSDGWDRTSQLSALGQILLDPYYRTFVGFRSLIEKDFCSFGHMFDKRICPVNNKYTYNS